jgi:hypothetical protein
MESSHEQPELGSGERKMATGGKTIGLGMLLLLNIPIFAQQAMAAGSNNTNVRRASCFVRSGKLNAYIGQTVTITFTGIEGRPWRPRSYSTTSR